MQRIELLDPGFQPDGPVIRACDLASYRAADALLRETRAACDAERALLDREVQAARAEGHAQGLREGLADLVAAASAYRARLGALADQIEDLTAKAIHQALGSLPRAEVLQAALAGLLPDLDMTGDVVIAVHPSHEADLWAALRALGLAAGAGRSGVHVEVQEDMDTGDCMIFCQSEVVKVSVTLAAQELVEALREETAERAAVLRAEPCANAGSPPPPGDADSTAEASAEDPPFRAEDPSD